MSVTAARLTLPGAPRLASGIPRRRSDGLPTDGEPWTRHGDRRRPGCCRCWNRIAERWSGGARRRRRPLEPTAPTRSSGRPKARETGCNRCRGQPGADRPLARHRPADPILLANTERFARGLPANNALLWGARGMGKSVAGQGGPRRRQRDARRPAAGADRDPPGGDPDPAPAAARPARVRPAVPVVLRRPVVRPAGQQLQVAQGRAGRRRRGAAGQRAVLRDLEPPPPDAARHDRERALERDQPGERWRRRSRCPTGSACGWASTTAIRKPSSPWSRATPSATAWRSTARRCTPRPRNGQVTRGARSGRVAWQYIQDLAGRLGKRLG